MHGLPRAFTPGTPVARKEPLLSALALRALALLFFGLLAAFAYAVYAAPPDSMQGDIQKILYLHAPLAFGAYLGFGCTALFGALYLLKRDERWDRMALACAEVGVLLCTLVLLTGPIWAKGTWGRWWSWDLRLTLTLLLWFIYLAYLLLRAFTEGGERAARFAAVYGIAGLSVVPLNRFAIELSGGRAIHPGNMSPGDGSLGDGMALPFSLGVLTVVACFAWLATGRFALARLQDEVQRREVEQEEQSPWDT